MNLKIFQNCVEMARFIIKKDNLKNSLVCVLCFHKSLTDLDTFHGIGKIVRNKTTVLCFIQRNVKEDVYHILAMILLLKGAVYWHRSRVPKLTAFKTGTFCRQGIWSCKSRHDIWARTHSAWICRKSEWIHWHLNF